MGGRQTMSRGEADLHAQGGECDRVIAPEEPEVKERILFDYPDRFISRVISKTKPYPSTPNLMSAKISIKTLGAQFAPPTLKPVTAQDLESFSSSRLIPHSTTPSSS